MGRVARYKKLKACDPFSKRSLKDRANLDPVTGLLLDPRKRLGSKHEKLVRKRLKRGKRVDNDYLEFGFDRPIQNEDDFDLDDPNLTVKKTSDEEEIVKMDAAAGDACDLREEARVARLLNIDSRSLSVSSSSTSLKKKGIVEGKKEGETLRAFRKRAREETRQLMKDITMKERTEGVKQQNVGGDGVTKQEKRKEFLKNKKRKKKAKKLQHINAQASDQEDGSDNDGDTTPFITADKTKVLAVARSAHLGDQVERPPQLDIRPRGAPKKQRRSDDDNVHGGRGGGMTDAQRLAEQKAMEVMRRKVQAQYAVIKAQRKKKGDFHL